MFRFSAATLAALPLALLASSCKRAAESRAEVVVTRTIDPEKESRPRLDATSAERFPMMGSSVEQGPLRYSVPPSWEQRPSGGMRIADFRIGPQGEGECYLSYLPGGGGGVEANVNRWRTQLELEALDEAQLATLPLIEMLGGQAAFVDYSGTYKGMRDPQPVPNSRLLGAVMPLGEMTLFVKMVGPAELVAAERDAFVRFCSSLKFNRQAAPLP